MRIITNPKKIQRNYKIGLYTSLGSLVLLFVAVGLTLSQRTELSLYSLVAMAAGLVMSQVGVYYANRWGKSPRVDERISQGLKGLDDRYTLYHYVSPVPHLLTGPSGIWVLAGQYQMGTISFEKGRYQQRGVGIFSRMVGQEGLGRPDLEARALQSSLEKFLKEQLPGEDLPEVQTALVFTNPKVNVQIQGAPLPSMHVDKLKDFIRRKAKEQPALMAKIQKVEDVLPDEDVA